MSEPNRGGHGVMGIPHGYNQRGEARVKLTVEMWVVAQCA